MWNVSGWLSHQNILRFLKLTTGLVLTTQIFACANKRGDGGGGSSGGDVVAVTPNNCMRPGTCNEPTYYSIPGFSPYLRDSGRRYVGYHNRYKSGFCGCPQGSVPTSRAGRDMGCISQAIIPVATPIAYWSWNPNSFQFAAGYVVTEQPVVLNTGYVCTRNVIFNCEVGYDLRDCGPRHRCAPLDARIGLCY